MKDIVLKYPVDFITGDFNMSLWEVCTQLRINHPATTMLAWYGWKTAAGESYNKVERDSTRGDGERAAGRTDRQAPMRQLRYLLAAEACEDHASDARQCLRERSCQVG